MVKSVKLVDRIGDGLVNFGGVVCRPDAERRLSCSQEKLEKSGSGHA